MAISLFVDEMFQESDLRHSAPLNAPLPSADKADPCRFDMERWGYAFTLFWLTAEEFDSALGAPPQMAGSADTSRPGWLTQSPLEYFGRDNLPSSAFYHPTEHGYAPGAYALQRLMASEQPPSGWKTLPAIDALEFGFPIHITLREGDPNVGRPARERDEENAISGYVPVFSEEGEAAGLGRFGEFDAHLGGTMFPLQAYPDFSPFYLEFQETFGGFAFGGGIAQIDLTTMQIDWAS